MNGKKRAIINIKVKKMNVRTVKNYSKEGKKLKKQEI
jgi:hypothetical protein